jgi:hypothetical protein
MSFCLTVRRTPKTQAALLRPCPSRSHQYRPDLPPTPKRIRERMKAMQPRWPAKSPSEHAASLTRVSASRSPQDAIAAFAGGALPVGHEEGSARLELGPSLSWDSGPATYWVAGALPVVGEVMDWRAELGLRWSFGVGAASSRCRCNGAP